MGKKFTRNEKYKMTLVWFSYSKNVANVEVFCKGILLKTQLLFLKSVVRKRAEDEKLILHLWTK